MAKVPGEWGEYRARFEGLRTEKSLRRRLIILSLGIHLEISHRSWHARIRVQVVGGTVMVAKKTLWETTLKELSGFCFPIKIFYAHSLYKELIIRRYIRVCYVTFYIITLFVSIFCDVITRLVWTWNWIYFSFSPLFAVMSLSSDFFIW